MFTNQDGYNIENYELGQDEQFSIVSVEKSSFKARRQLIK